MLVVANFVDKDIVGRETVTAGSVSAWALDARLTRADLDHVWMRSQI